MQSINELGGRVLRRAFDDRTAVTAIEYGLIAGLIAVAIVVGAKLLGVTLSSVFNTVAANVSTAASG